LLLGRAQPADDLFHIDRGGRRKVASKQEIFEALSSRSISEVVDQNGGVKQVKQELTNPAVVGGPLRPDPLGGVAIPVVVVTS
jgi:hypothetical protein